MVSPIFGNDKFCFKFYFDIEPKEGIKTLIVLREEQNDNRDQTVMWQISDVKLDFWEEGQFYLEDPGDFRASFCFNKSNF